MSSTQVPDSGGSVAVIVVSGVGDDTLGSGRDGIVAALTSDPDARWGRAATATGDENLVASADSGDDATGGGPLRTGKGSPNLREPFTVPTARLTGTGGAPDVDVYEMHWADLSRAQGPAQRVFYLLFAITMQVSTLGLEAVRLFPRQTPTTRRIAKLLNLISYLLAYVITPIVLAMLVLAVAVNVALLTQTRGQTGWVLFAVIALAGVAAGWWLAERTYRGGWTFDPPGDPWAIGDAPRSDPWPFATLLTVTVVALVTVVCLASGIARLLVIQVAFLVTVGSVAVYVATRLIRRGHRAGADLATQRRTRRRVRTVIRAAYAAVPVGAMLLAVLAEPRTGGAAVRAANALTLVAAGPLRIVWIVLLVASAAAVVLALVLRYQAKGNGAEERRLSATVLTSVMLGPVLYALASSALFLVFAAVWKLYPDSAQRWPGPGIRCPGDTVDPLTVTCADTIETTADWGTGVVRAVVQPLGLALLLCAVAIGLIGWFFRPYVATFRARMRSANAADVSDAQGTAFSGALARSGADWMFAWVFTPLVVMVAGAAVVVWCLRWHPVQAVGDFFASVAFPLAYVLAILGVAGVGLRGVSGIGGLGAGFLRSLGLVLDTIYDVTSYLRVANPAIVAPRVKMIARYRAVLARARAADRVIVMAHSQGTILTLATLLGDPHRTPPVAAPPADVLPHSLTYLSYGSPLAQTYAQRFPGQFEQWIAQATADGSPICAWLNVYRAGDFIGRGIIPPMSFDPGGADEPPVRERCLGPGQHTGYLVDERWRRIARHVVATPPPANLRDVDLDDLTVPSLDSVQITGEATAELPTTRTSPY